MPARTGAQYIEGLKQEREVWLEGERVSDVTSHPAFRGAIRSLAAVYDLQHAAPECLVEHPETGDKVNVSHLIPRSAQDLTRRHHGLRRVAELSVGLLGRTPDYLNVTFAGFAGRTNLWSLHGNEEGCANLVAYQRALAQHDWALTHAIIHPTVDKGLGDLAAGKGEVALHKIADTEHGIVVRGARVLATLAPLSDELAVYPGQLLPRDAHKYALAFAIPVGTPGLKLFCRSSCATTTGGVFEYPFSSRFDEQDAFVVFDDVEIPRERVFIDGSCEVYNKVLASGSIANIMQHSAIRSHVKLCFAYELACRMADTINAADPGTKELLGELWSYAELTRSALQAAEAGAHEWGNGTWFCDERPFRALRGTLPRWFPRVKEILMLIGSHNLLAAPFEAELDRPELKPLLGRYLQGARGLDARERVKIFRAAWDFCGSALGGRNELYERFYLASASRSYQMAHARAQAEADPSTSLVDRVLGSK